VLNKSNHLKTGDRQRALRRLLPFLCSEKPYAAVRDTGVRIIFHTSEIALSYYSVM
jgi:hypothetical protein